MSLFHTMALERGQDLTTEETKTTNLLSSSISFKTSKADIATTTCKAKKLFDLGQVFFY